jgi:hypothetical protein
MRNRVSIAVYYNTVRNTLLIKRNKVFKFLFFIGRKQREAFKNRGF